MIRLVVLSSLVYVAAVAETSLIDAAAIAGVSPDLLALVAIAWLLVVVEPRAFLVAGAVALLGDLIAPGRLGVGTAWMLVVGYAVGRLQSRLRWKHLAAQLLTVWVAVTVWAAGVAVTSRLIDDLTLPWSTIPMRAAAVGLYTAAFGLPILMVVGWIREPKATRQRRIVEA